MLAWWIKQSSFQVGLFFTWALAKEAKIQHSKYWISTVTVCREYRHTYFQQSLGVLRTYRRSSLKLLSTLIWEIAQPDAARAHLRADLNLYGEAHSFGRSAFHIDQKVSLDLFEAYSDSKAADSKAEPVRALEAVKASGRLARSPKNHPRRKLDQNVLVGILDKEQKIYQGHRYWSLNESLFGSFLCNTDNKLST